MQNKLTVKELRMILANPFYCITVDETFIHEHEYLVSEEMWIKAAVNTIKETGPELFLRNLLENLKGGFVETKH